ncbi:MAG: PEP-CTERM sorting domain-containing protein [Planctomycetota bacterium]|nr:MAG: PEP-CTERM sorting domain-containing protein [Planctomycetota bacterium]REJ94615.1 MAG: PEP-CTERM sorting domain-containing protein [Planctomycetota bacterium]
MRFMTQESERQDGLRRWRSRYLTGALALLALAASLLLAAPSWAAAVIFNTGDVNTATLALGVNDEGSLNVADPFGVFSPTPNVVVTGLTHIGVGDAISPGCLCEGWGVSGTHVGSGVAHTGFANEHFGGATGLTVGSFVTDAASGTGSTAVSVTSLSSLPSLTIEQAYAPSSIVPSALFENRVTITNTTGSAIDDLRYVRVLDWDVPPTVFSETVSILGVETTTALEHSHNNGFVTPNPLDPIAPTDALTPATLDVSFTDLNTIDHGAYFQFNFGTLADGETREFSVFYGAALGEAAADAAVAAEGLELYSYGQHHADPLGGTPATFIFGFKDVGGSPPNPVPEPSTYVMAALGLIGLTSYRLRRRR